MLVYTTMPPASSPLRVAVLECDTPIGRTKEKYGGYGNLFKELLHKGVDEVREKDGVEVPELDVRKYDVVNDELYPSLEDVDAVLLSGSREFIGPSCACAWGRERLGLMRWCESRTQLFRQRGLDREAGGVCEEGSRARSRAVDRHLLWASDYWARAGAEGWEE